MLCEACRHPTTIDQIGDTGEHLPVQCPECHETYWTCLPEAEAHESFLWRDRDGIESIGCWMRLVKSTG